MISPDTADLRMKVRQLFSDGFGDAVHALEHCAEEHLQATVARTFGLTDESLDVAVHLSDWREDAAALLAISLAPDHFTPEEIEECLTAFLIHVPNHVLAAANLAGLPPSAAQGRHRLLFGCRPPQLSPFSNARPHTMTFIRFTVPSDEARIEPHVAAGLFHATYRSPEMAGSKKATRRAHRGTQ